MEYYDAEGNHLSAEEDWKYWGSTEGEWKQVAADFGTPNENVVKARIYLRLMGAGELSVTKKDVAGNADTEAVSLLMNGNFEASTKVGGNVTTDSWSIGAGAWGTHLNLKKMNVHEGDYALGLKPDTEHKQPFLKQYITGLTEKATYTLTGYIKKDSLTGTPATKILFYDNNGTSYTDKGSEGYEFHTTENGQWTQITNTFTVPDGADTAEVYLRVLESASGADYWDDLTVEMVL